MENAAPLEPMLPPNISGANLILRGQCMGIIISFFRYHRPK